ncbi:WD40-repeat-containing domain protein [Daedaleopsis nitida]|nr:WD40-repeat-containing domain protein [Daedaleopsis nitida]
MTLADFLRLTRRLLPRLHHSSLHTLSITLPYLNCTSLGQALGKDAQEQCLTLDDFLDSHRKARVVFDLPSVKRNSGEAWTRLLGLHFPKLQARGTVHVISSADDRAWGHDSAVKVLQVYPDSGALLSGSVDGNVLTWDMHQEGVLRSSCLLGSRVGALSITLTPLPRVGRFACIEGSQNIAIWDVAMGQKVKTLKADERGVNAFACSPDGRIIVTASVKRQAAPRIGALSHRPYQVDVRFWQNSAGKGDYKVVDTMSLRTQDQEPGLFFPTRSNRPQDVFDVPEQIKAVALSPTGLVLACIEKHGTTTLCRFWRFRGGGVGHISTSHPRWSAMPPLYDRVTPVTAWAFCPTPYIPASTPHAIHSFESEADLPREQCECFATGFAAGRVVMSYIPLGWRPGYMPPETDHYTGGRVTKRIAAHSKAVTSITFSADGRLLVSTSADGTIKAAADWADPYGCDVRRVPTMKGHTGAVHAACVSPSGRFIASASEDKTVRLWSTRDWSCVATFTEHRAAVTHVVFTPEGDAVWSGARDGAVRRHPFLHMVRGGA